MQLHSILIILLGLPFLGIFLPSLDRRSHGPSLSVTLDTGINSFGASRARTRGRATSEINIPNIVLYHNWLTKSSILCFLCVGWRRRFARMMRFCIFVFDTPKYQKHKKYSCKPAPPAKHKNKTKNSAAQTQTKTHDSSTSKGAP